MGDLDVCVGDLVKCPKESILSLQLIERANGAIIYLFLNFPSLFSLFSLFLNNLYCFGLVRVIGHLLSADASLV